MVEVNLSGKESKFGIASENLIEVIEQISKLSRISIIGRMTIFSFHENPEESRPYFRQLREPVKIKGVRMDISLEEWKKIFGSLKNAKHLKFLRICTGDLFLGEPLRLADPEFLELLKKWYQETGKPIKFVFATYPILN